jgi:Ala-tRNA(Pro) deacylase
MPSTQADLFALLDRLGIAHATTRHEAVFTVAESASVKEAIPGGHTKNLFLKDKKGRLFLVTAEAHTPIDLKRLHETLGASGRLSFGSAELLRATLGVEPGSVTPFAAMNDAPPTVDVVLDARLMEHAQVNVHPLVNTATTTVAREDLVRFLEATGHPPRVLALPAPEGPGANPPGAPS